MKCVDTKKIDDSAINVLFYISKEALINYKLHVFFCVLHIKIIDFSNLENVRNINSINMDCKTIFLIYIPQ